MSRQLVLCFDGTNNTVTGGRRDTNVVKLCKVLAPSPTQLLYYDPGVGNPGDIPGVTMPDKLRGKVARLWGLAFGKGIYENIAEAYLFLMRNWHPDDDIYVFGFSRGAFTARSLAGMVARFGILRPSIETMVPTLLHLYFADPERGAKHYKDIQQQIGQSFCDPAGATARIWFVGVWDTVESVGAPFSRRRIRTSSTIVGKRFQHVRQALALDEHRRSFAPRPYYIHPTFDYAAAGQSVRQLWWSGAHCDIGGGYAEPESELSDRSLLWMLDEAVAMGLQVQAGLVRPDGSVDQAAAASAVRTGSPPLPQRPALVHSDTFTEAYWALTGLYVRDFVRADGARGDPPPKPPIQHPPPTEKPLRVQQDTIWSGGQFTRLLAAVLAGLAFWLLHGMAISGHTLLEQMESGFDIPGLWSGVQQLASANSMLASWQLGWWRAGPDAVAQLPVAVPHPLWMLWTDLGLILCYGYLLALGLARGFAHWAGLRGVAQGPPRTLNLLGWSGALIVLSDLAEDLLMLLVLIAGWLGWTLVQDALAALMTLASALKWFGFLPAAVLIARALR